MNGFFRNFCANALIANYTSPYIVYQNEEHLFHAISQCYEKNNFPEIIITPRCQRSHWTVCIFDIERKIYFCVDPLSNNSNKGDTIVQKTLVLLDSRKKLKFIYESIAHNRQRGAWECGYMVMLVAYRYVMGFSLDITPECIENFRKYLTEIIEKTFRYF